MNEQEKQTTPLEEIPQNCEILQDSEDAVECEVLESQPEKNAELQAALAKQEEYLNMALRTQADFENYKKRNASIRKDAFDEGKLDIAKGLLPVIDNFERALQVAPEDQSPILIGIRMVHKQILDLFEKNSIFVIDRKGEVFDPSLEEAVTQGSPEDGEPGTVCEVLQKGYRMNNTVLRHSMVKVVPE